MSVGIQTLSLACPSNSPCPITIPLLELVNTLEANLPPTEIGPHNIHPPDPTAIAYPNVSVVVEYRNLTI